MSISSTRRIYTPDCRLGRVVGREQDKPLVDIKNDVILVMGANPLKPTRINAVDYEGKGKS